MGKEPFHQMVKALATLSAVALMFCVDLKPEAPMNIALVKDAQAWVGRPLTPGSVAGVARRTTRRTVAASTAVVATGAAATTAAATAPTTIVVTTPPVGTVVAALPAGCAQTVTVVDGVSYHVCGGVYYRTGFQGNNVVYVVTRP